MNIKNCLLSVSLLTGFALASTAQTHYQMTIYDKNGFTYNFDVNQIKEMTFAEVPYSEEEIAAFNDAMENVCFHLRGTLGRRYMEAQSLASDEFTAVSFDGDYYDGGAYANPSLHNNTATDATIYWGSDVINGINKANMFLANYGNMASEQQKAAIRAMRAYFTWIYMDSFGDTPILDKVPAEGETIERAPRKEVAEWIEKELKEIIPSLTEEVSENTYGKPTRWMAEALLAKLYINWPVYTAESTDLYDATTANNVKLNDCIAICDDIINSGKFNLGDNVDYLHKFSYNNGAHIKDFIYAMPYDALTQQGMQYARSHSFRQLKNLLPNVYGSSQAFNQSFGGYIVVTPEFVKLFCLEGDIRNLCILRGDIYNRDANTLRPTTEPFIYDNNQVHFTEAITLKNVDNNINVGKDADAYQQGCHSIKWFTTPEDYNNGRNQSNDLPIFRYADILLTKAEALTRLGQGGAMDLFNQIRTYAGAPTLSAEPTLNDIYDERGRELFDENWRRNDMIRFGHFEDEFFPHYQTFPSANFDKRHRIFPLDQTLLDQNPNWKQNPGY